MEDFLNSITENVDTLINIQHHKAEIESLEDEMLEPGAETVNINEQIETIRRDISVLENDIKPIMDSVRNNEEILNNIARHEVEIEILENEMLEPGADIVNISSQIESMRRNIANWKSGLVSNKTILELKEELQAKIAHHEVEIEILENEMLESGADTVNINAQIETMMKDIAIWEKQLKGINSIIKELNSDNEITTNNKTKNDKNIEKENKPIDNSKKEEIGKTDNYSLEKNNGDVSYPDEARTDKDEEKLIIKYDNLKAPNNEYSYSYQGKSMVYKVTDELKGNIKDKYTRLREIIDKEDYDKIIGGRDYRKIKYCDPELICILYNTKGVDGANAYLDQLEKGKDADKSKLPYTMTYDLKSIWKNKNLTLKQKFNITKMARENKNVAKVEPERKLGKTWIAFLAAIGIGGGALALPASKNDNIERIPKETKNVAVEEIGKETNQKINTKPSWELSEDDIVEINKKNEEIVANSQNKVESQQNRKEQVQLGDVLQLSEGMEFTESVFGGKRGEIGNDESPVNGMYVIDRSAEVDENGVNVKYGLNGKVERKIKDSKQFVHISFVRGAKTLEEAQKIINEQKENAENEVIDEGIISPRGWIAQDEIEKIYNKQQYKGQER